MKKVVDRRASKGRKIRYVVHDKILNFLAPLHNLEAMEGKEALVGNLFGAKKVVIVEQLAGKKRKNKEVVKDDIALI